MVPMLMLVTLPIKLKNKKRITSPEKLEAIIIAFYNGFVKENNCDCHWNDLNVQLSRWVINYLIWCAILLQTQYQQLLSKLLHNSHRMYQKPSFFFIWRTVRIGNVFYAFRKIMATECEFYIKIVFLMGINILLSWLYAGVHFTDWLLEY